MKSRWVVEFLFDYIPFVKDHQVEVGIGFFLLFFSSIFLFLICSFIQE